MLFKWQTIRLNVYGQSKNEWASIYNDEILISKINPFLNKLPFFPVELFLIKRWDGYWGSNGVLEMFDEKFLFESLFYRLKINIDRDERSN